MKRPMPRSAQLRPGRERGIALIFCMFALILLSSIALGLIYMSDTETTINQNFRSSQQAYFAAYAGIEEARSRMVPGLVGGAPVPCVGLPCPTTLPGVGPGSVVYILNPKLKSDGLEVIDPMAPANKWFDDELCHGNFPNTGLVNSGLNIPCAPIAPPGVGWWSYVNSTSPFTGTAAALNFKWVRVNLKINASNAPYYVDGVGGAGSNNTQICWDGNNERLMPLGYAACDLPAAGGDTMKPVYVVTALAEGSRRIAQVEVAQNPPLITHAAVDSQDHVTLNGQLSVNGYDFCSCDCKVDAKTGQTVCTDRVAGRACDRGKWGIYSASTVDNPNKSELIVAGMTPPVAENMLWTYDVPCGSPGCGIDKMIRQYKDTPGAVNVSNQAPYNFNCVGTPPSLDPNGHADCGTQSGKSFGVPPTFPPTPPDNPAGPLNMASQVTYVPGDLHMTGGTIGNGILIVDGDLDIDGGLQFYGLILVRGVVRFTGGGSAKTNIYGAVLAGRQSIDDTVLGGSASIYLDICALTNNKKPQPPTMLSFRELTY